MNLSKKIVLSIICFWPTLLTGQQKDSLSIKNGIEIPSNLTTHHFGIFSSRINQNFKIKPPKSTELSLSSISGNNFHPFLEAYFPQDPEVRKALSEVTWYDRNFTFVDQETTPAEYMNIVVDAVIKEFRFGVHFPLSKHHELSVALRSYFISNGKYPFSYLTGDKSIEWFHSHLAGGEDPFGRRYYGLEQVNFKYTNRSGDVLELHNNDFFLGGIELNYFYYPSLAINKNKSAFFNFGTHLGINTSKFNNSLDLGVSANAVKNICFKNDNELNLVAGISFLYKNLIDFQDVIDLGNNSILANIESGGEYTMYTKNMNYHAFGIIYQIQSRYNKGKEADYYKLLGKWQEINAGWHYGVTKLYKALSNWTFLYTYGRKNYKLTLYVKEDFLVNNAPDIQTGIGINIPLKK